MNLKSIIASPANRPLWIAGCISFFLTGLATAPASIAASIAKSAVPSIEFGGVEGTLWRGVMNGVAYNGIDLGRITYQLRPAELLLGRASADVTSDGGALIGRTHVAASFSGVTLTRLNAQFNLAAIRRYNFFGLRYQGTATISANRLAFAKGRCRAEDAKVATTLLDALARQWTGGDLPLAGDLQCEGDKLLLNLAGGGSAGSLQARASLAPDLAYDLSVTAAPKHAEIGAALRQIGFEESGQGLEFRANGGLKGIGS